MNISTAPEEEENNIYMVYLIENKELVFPLFTSYP
jgi:hypothetical protein